MGIARRSTAVGLALLAGTLLAGCPTVDLGDSPPEIGQCRPDPAYFDEVVWPEYLAPADPDRSCVSRSGCHSADTGRSALRLDTSSTSMQVLDANYEVAIRFLNCATPSASLLLEKPLAGVEAHAGGDLFTDASDPAVTAFLGWFAP